MGKTYKDKAKWTRKNDQRKNNSGKRNDHQRERSFDEEFYRIERMIRNQSRGE